MKRSIYALLISVIFFNPAGAQKPEKIYSIAKADKPHSYFVEQAELWWKEIEADESNEIAWRNYYKANRYAMMTFYQCVTPECEKYKSWLEESEYLKEAEDIKALINKAIPNTFTYYIFIKEGYPNDEQRFRALQNAYDLEPDNPDTYDEFVVFYESNNDMEGRAEFNQKWFKSNELSVGILNYNYNVLMSMRDDGAILAFGDNDTFPIWMLQDVLNIRPDVTVMNVHLLSIHDYRERIFKKLNIPDLPGEFPKGSTAESQKEIIDHIIKNKPAGLPLYIGTPAWKQFKEYDEDLYIVGLALEYSEENIDNIALLKNNFENKYALDYIRNQFSYDISQGIVNRINVNYLPGIIKLYEHYKLSGETENAEHIKTLGLVIAERGGEDWQKKVAELFE
ncbi:MAG: hypothetical protein JXB49_31940 [Bacteroidales bacterium]|nr:hypothetical protein [Bacteroidales bacterium]